MSVSNARKARGKGCVAFTRFCLDKKFHKSKIFCFFKGEDFKYYGPRIETYTEYSFEDIVPYQCNGRKDVLAVHSIITKNSKYKDVKKAYFIDHDYHGENGHSNEIYQTPCYSIENFYVTESAFRRMVNREFALGSHEVDYKKIICDYIDRQREFHNQTVLLNAWLYCQREEEERNKKQRIQLSGMKITKLFSKMSMDTIICKKQIDVSFIESLFPNNYELDSAHLSEVEIQFRNCDCTAIFRGKFEFEFFKKMILDLKNKNNDGGYFSRKIESVNLDPGVNPLSALSQYADTPACLMDFLAQYRKAS